MGCIRLLERVKNLGWKKERYQQNCCKAGGISMASASILAECKHQNISPSMVFDYTSILPPLDVLNTISSIVFCLTSYHKNEKWAEALIISRFVWARNLDSLARLPLICSKNLAWKSSPSFSGQLLLLRTSPSLPDTPVGGKTGHRPPLRDPPVGSNFTSTSLHRQILEKLGGKSGAVFFGKKCFSSVVVDSVHSIFEDSHPKTQKILYWYFQTVMIFGMIVNVALFAISSTLWYKISRLLILSSLENGDDQISGNPKKPSAPSRLESSYHLTFIQTFPTAV